MCFFVSYNSLVHPLVNYVSLNTRIRLLLPFFSGEPMTASASRLSDQEDIEVFVYTFGLLFAGLM